jgi:hypothetical protein
MSTRNLILLLLLSIVFYSCKNRNEKIISGSLNGRYWDVVKIKTDKFDNPRYCSYFGSNGDYFYYSYYFDEKLNKKIRIKFNYGDVIYPEKWYFENDSIINIQSFRYRILELTDNKLKIQNIEVSNDIKEYTRSAKSE